MATVRTRFEAEKGGGAVGERSFHGVEDGGVGVEILLVQAERAFGVVAEVAIRVAGVAKVNVVDAPRRERLAKRRLRKAAAARQREGSHIDDALDAGANQESDEVVELTTLVANGERDPAGTRKRSAFPRLERSVARSALLFGDSGSVAPRMSDSGSGSLPPASLPPPWT